MENEKDYNSMSIKELEWEINLLDNDVSLIRARMKHIHTVLDQKILEQPPSSANPKLAQTIGGGKK